jgi:hypothetical protein
MSRASLAGFCRRCGCTVKLGWQEPPHHLYSALTLSLIACQAVTPAIGGLMGLVWCHRVLTTGKWGCPHCGAAAAGANRASLAA